MQPTRMRLPKPIPDVPVQAVFPLGGIDLQYAFTKQLPKQIAQGLYVRTTPVAVNVRALDPTTMRYRGASRPGLSRYINAQVGGSSGLIQNLNLLVWQNSTNTTRTTEVVAVKGGVAYKAVAGATSWTTISTTGLPAGWTLPIFTTTGIVRSTFHWSGSGRIFFVDGNANGKYAYYNPQTGRMVQWNSSHPSGLRPRLICMWQRRIVISGSTVQGFVGQVSMSDERNPEDFNFAKLPVDPRNPIQKQVGDIVTALIPFSDDVLIIGTDQMIWRQSGNPVSGGSQDLLCDGLGIAFGEAWCKSPEGILYFFSTRNGVYAMSPGTGARTGISPSDPRTFYGMPQCISNPIRDLLDGINTNTDQYSVKLAWDDFYKGVHVFISKVTEAAADTHYFYEQATGGWFKVVHANNDHNPLTACMFDGPSSTDRKLLQGSWNGYVYAVDHAATKDDTTPIASEVYLTPIVSDDFDEVMLKEMQFEMGDDSEDVELSLLKGRTVQSALSATPEEFGTITAGRGYTKPIRRSAYALVPRLTSDGTDGSWQFEKCRAILAGKGPVRRRGR